MSMFRLIVLKIKGACENYLQEPPPPVLTFNPVSTAEPNPLIVPLDRASYRARRLAVAPALRDYSAKVVQRCAKKHGMKTTALMGARRDSKTATARQEAYWLIRNNTDARLTEIAEFFGRDHTTILHGINKHEARIRGQS